MGCWGVASRRRRSAAPSPPSRRTFKSTAPTPHPGTSVEGHRPDFFTTGSLALPRSASNSLLDFYPSGSRPTPSVWYRPVSADVGTFAKQSCARRVLGCGAVGRGKQDVGIDDQHRCAGQAPLASLRAASLSRSALTSVGPVRPDAPMPTRPSRCDGSTAAGSPSASSATRSSTLIPRREASARSRSTVASGRSSSRPIVAMLRRIWWAGGGLAALGGGARMVGAAHPSVHRSGCRALLQSSAFPGHDQFTSHPDRAEFRAPQCHRRRSPHPRPCAPAVSSTLPRPLNASASPNASFAASSPSAASPAGSTPGGPGAQRCGAPPRTARLRRRRHGAGTGGARPAPAWATTGCGRAPRRATSPGSGAGPSACREGARRCRTPAPSGAGCDSLGKRTLTWDLVAEGKGFEPLVTRRPQRLSRPPHSSALATFRRSA